MTVNEGLGLRILPQLPCFLNERRHRINRRAFIVRMTITCAPFRFAVSRLNARLPLGIDERLTPPFLR